MRTYTLPPGTPKDRVQMLRKAFDATLKTPDSSPMPKNHNSMSIRSRCEEVEKDIAGLFKLDPALITKLKDILYN